MALAVGDASAGAGIAYVYIIKAGEIRCNIFTYFLYILRYTFYGGWGNINLVRSRRQKTLEKGKVEERWQF